MFQHNRMARFLCVMLMFVLCGAQAESLFDQFVTPEPRGSHNIFDDTVDMTEDAGESLTDTLRRLSFTALYGRTPDNINTNDKGLTYAEFDDITPAEYEAYIRKLADMGCVVNEVQGLDNDNRACDVAFGNVEFAVSYIEEGFELYLRYRDVSRQDVETILGLYTVTGKENSEESGKTKIVLK